VEAATRDTGDLILVTEDVHRRLKRSPVEFDQRAGVVLKGMRSPVVLFAPRLGDSVSDRALNTSKSG
jgi:class 3 adenylate cyclase